MSYYAMIRKNRPTTIIEIGSGFSTLVARQAVAQNKKGRIICIEPFPQDWLRRLDDIDLIEKPAQSIDFKFYNEHLKNGDILFIDSTHTVKAGSDCLHVYLRVLPQIESDIYIHVHDIFLPYGMPLHWGTELHIHWTEQYLLLAYLLGNPRCAIIFGSHFSHKKLPEQARKLMHDYYPSGGGSLWFRQAEPDHKADSYLK